MAQEIMAKLSASRLAQISAGSVGGGHAEVFALVDLRNITSFVVDDVRCLRV